MRHTYSLNEDVYSRQLHLTLTEPVKQNISGLCEEQLAQMLLHSKLEWGT